MVKHRFSTEERHDLIQDIRAYVRVNAGCNTKEVAHAFRKRKPKSISLRAWSAKVRKLLNDYCVNENNTYTTEEEREYTDKERKEPKPSPVDYREVWDRLYDNIVDRQEETVSVGYLLGYMDALLSEAYRR